MMRGTRHYGLDWLRIAAFALLIFYHVAMVFSPWAWIIKTSHGYAELTVPMLLLTPWRLPLLFAVSGYASRKLFDRSGDVRDFAHSRALRLLIPLAFGMAVIVPPEMWVRVMEAGYPYGYLHFWAFDYVRSGIFYRCEFPSWEHLWFIAYLSFYTAILVGAVAWRGKRMFVELDRIADWLDVGARLLWVPVAVLAVLRLALLFIVPEHQGVATDWQSHLLYMPLFLFGFTLAGAPRLWYAIHRWWRGGLVMAALGGATVIAVEWAYPGTTVPPHHIMAVDRFCRIAMAWGMIMTLLHVAETHWNHDHSWRKPLAEAVFPAYIVHHPAIVLIAWYTLPLNFGPVGEFAVLLAGTATTCAIAYLVGRRIPWLRPLIGLAPVTRPARSGKGAAPAL